MARKVKSERDLLFLQYCALVPARRFDQCGPRMRSFVSAAEQAHLLCVALELFRGSERDADRGELPGAMIVDCIERAGTDQRFDHASVDDTLVDALAEIEQVLEG